MFCVLPISISLRCQAEAKFEARRAAAAEKKDEVKENR